MKTAIDYDKINTKSKKYEYCVHALDEKNEVLLGKECKNEYLILSITVCRIPYKESLVSVIKEYYDYYTNEKGFRLGIRNMHRKMRVVDALKHNISASNYIENDLFDLVMQKHWVPITLEKNPETYLVDIPYAPYQKVKEVICQ